MLKAGPNKQLKARSRREILFTKHNFFFKIQNYFAIYSSLQYNLGIEFCSASVTFTIVFLMQSLCRHTLILQGINKEYNKM